MNGDFMTRRLASVAALLPTHLATLFALLLTLVAAVPASAQLVAAKDGPVVYGHHHVATKNPAAHLKFWADALGGTVIKFGANNLDVVKFPNVFIFFRDQMPTGGTRGTTVNHIGFSVPDLRPVIDRIKAHGFQMITRSEVAPTVVVTDDIAANSPTTSIAFALGPDDVKVELVQVKAQTLPVALHHVHFFGQQNAEMRAWYEKVFGAKPRATAGAFLAADLPGVALNFSPSPDPVVGTSGRSVDHIGFEVKNLEAFVKSAEAMGVKVTVPFRSPPGFGLSLAFVQDPWGTSIELNEGLDKIP
jgi:catechol 2,3-dioxygenase-like lactoylglutathione lyase family enzyme